MRLHFAAMAVAFAATCLIPRSAAAQRGGAGGVQAQAALEEAKKASTPKTADGHPDLTGFWGGAGGGGGPLKGPSEISSDGKTITVQLAVPDVETKLEAGQTAAREKATLANLPPYKPELLAKVKAFISDPNRTDPTFRCLPAGVPRMGAPAEIMQGQGAVALLYASRNTFRLIPTDGRPHDKDAEFLPAGDSIGHWDGNTLVVDTTNLSDDTWLGTGYFHSTATHVVERFTREGNTLTYSYTVDDPNVFTQVWAPRPRTILLGKAGEHVGQDYPCYERDQPNLLTNDHH